MSSHSRSPARMGKVRTHAMREQMQITGFRSDSATEATPRSDRDEGPPR
jgi:hypothetical protein